MKKIMITTIAAGLIAGAATGEVTSTFDFASAYVFRGYTFNDGLVFQPGLEATGFGLPEAYGAVTLGAWANMDLNEYLPSRSTSEFSEIDLYFSYSLPTFVEGLDLFVGYTDYTYPNLVGSSEKEANIGAGYEVAGVGFGLTAYEGIGGAINGNLYIEGTAGYGFDFTEEFSGAVDASIGFYDYDDGESGFNDYSLGASLAYLLGEVWSAGFSLTYIGQGDDAVLPDAGPIPAFATDSIGYDTSVVGTLSLGASF